MATVAVILSIFNLVMVLLLFAAFGNLCNHMKGYALLLEKERQKIDGRGKSPIGKVEVQIIEGMVEQKVAQQLKKYMN